VVATDNVRAGGYTDLVDQYEAGAKANKTTPGSFYKYASNYRSLASRLTLRFADTFAEFDKAKDDSVTLDFPFPSGTAAAVPQLSAIAQGNFPPAATADIAEQRALERGILLAMRRAADAPGDTAIAEQILKSDGGKVLRATFSLAMAKTVFESAQLYSRQHLSLNPAVPRAGTRHLLHPQRHASPVFVTKTVNCGAVGPRQTKDESTRHGTQLPDSG
jgi:hypothetical protein